MEKIKDLRIITQAGMKDCKDALTEAGGDLQKAIDLIKTKGKNVVLNNKTTAEGLIGISRFENSMVMVEVNCVTDFVARMPEFNKFVDHCLDSLCESVNNNIMWSSDKVDDNRKELISITKENINVNRWWVETMFKDGMGLFSYVHTNGKIGVIMTILTSEEFVKHPDVIELGNNITLQIASMKPLAVSSDRLDIEAVTRQKSIFEQQIIALNKPAANHDKIMEGKLNKWYSEVCLLDQDYVVCNVPGKKISVGQMIKNLETVLNIKIEIVNFNRCEVGDGIEKPKEDFSSRLTDNL